MKRSSTAVLAIFGLCALLVPAQVKKATKPPPDKTNLTNCVEGLSGCDISLLNADELSKVTAASKKRNLDYCLNGSSLCDPTRLTGSEANSVQAARYRRNLEKCTNGA